MKKKVYSASWTIGFCCPASCHVKGEYGATGKARSRSLVRAVQQAKRNAERLFEEERKRVPLEVRHYAECVLDDGAADIPGDLSQFWLTSLSGKLERRTRSKELIARILKRREE